MNGRISVVHLTYREGLSSVFPAQVARPMSMIRDRGYDARLVVFSALGEYVRATLRRRWAEQQELTRLASGLEISRIPSPPSRTPDLWNESVLFRRWLGRHAAVAQRTIVHCRGTQATLMAYKAMVQDRGWPIVFDCRGLDGPEFLMVNGFNDPAKAPQEIRRGADLHRRMQLRAAEISSRIICVSNAMKCEIQRQWSIPSQKICVIPCCTDVEVGDQAKSQRAHIRERLGLAGRFVVSYCGGLSPWQMLEESLFVTQLIFSMRSDAHLLAITTNPKRFEALADKAQIGAYRRSIISVSHKEVPNYLAAADVGLLIRSRTAVNSVASPVKFAEYMACGVPVLMTEAIGDYSELVHRNRIGCIVTDIESREATMQTLEHFLSNLDKDANSIRERCVSTAKRCLNWQNAILDLCALYDSLADATNINPMGRNP